MPSTSSVATGSPASFASPASTLVLLHAGVSDAFLYLSRHGLPSYEHYILLDSLPHTDSSSAGNGGKDADGASLYQALTKSKGRFVRVLSRLYDEATAHDSAACVVHFNRYQNIAYHYNVDFQRLLPGQHPLPERFDLFLSAQSPAPTWLPSLLARSSAPSSSDAPASPLSCRPRLFLCGHKLDATSVRGVGGRKRKEGVEVVDLAAAVAEWEARQPRRLGNVLSDVRAMERKERKEEAKKTKKVAKATPAKMAWKEVKEGEEENGQDRKKAKKGAKQDEDAEKEKKQTTATAMTNKEVREKKNPVKKRPTKANPFVQK